MKNNLKELAARLEFWWARRRLKDGRDFMLSFDHLGLLVSITRGKFGGVDYRYANMVMHEGELDFSTVVVYNPLNADVSSEEFIKLTSNILRIIIQDAVQDETKLNVTEQVKNENRDSDTGELIEERDFYEESSPVLEKRVSKRKPRTKTVRTDKPVHSKVQQPAKPKRTRTRTPRTK